MVALNRRGQTSWNQTTWNLLREKNVDTAGSPSGDARSEEIGVFRPDRTVKSKGRCENRPVLRIACSEAFPRFGFEVTVQIIAHNGGECGQLPSKQPAPLPD